MLLIPIGLADFPLRRTPWISIAIGLTCLVVHLQTEAPEQEVRKFHMSAELREYWSDHPYLVPPVGIAAVVPPDEVRKARAAYDQQKADGTLPDAETLAREMTTWESLFVAATRTSPSYEWGLVPARGWAQPGWISAMFLHGSWLHLIGNLLFFAVVGPTLEQLLSPIVFLGFYLVGGVTAGLGQVLVNPHSEIPMIGASGAIAACMGAFTVRFASDHVRLIFFRGLGPRLVEWPAWIWAALWVFEQLLMVFLNGAAGGGVALVAHLSGFAFGMAVAGVLRATGWGGGLEDRAPSEESSREPGDPLSRAEALVDRKDLPGAVRAYRTLLWNEPDNIPAKWGLVRVLFRTGERAEASRLFNEVLRKWLDAGHANQFLIQRAVGVVGHQLDPRELSPDCARAVAPHLEGIDEALAVAAYEVAGRR